MDLSLSIQSIKNLFSFPFRDPRWVTKFLIGSGISLAGLFIPIVPWLAVWGYIARLIRAGAANEDAAHLPEWDNWGDLLLDGLRQFGVVLIYILPSLVVFGFGWLLYMAGILAIAGTQNNPSSSDGRVIFMMFSMLIFFLCIGLGLLLALAALLVMPAAQAHTAVNRRFGAAFNISGWWRVLRANFSGFLIGAGMFLVLETLLMFVFQFLYLTLLLCLFAPLLVLPASFYIILIVYRLFGQAYGEGSHKASMKLELPAVPPPAASTAEAV